MCRRDVILISFSLIAFLNRQDFLGSSVMSFALLDQSAANPVGRGNGGRPEVKSETAWPTDMQPRHDFAVTRP